MAPTKEKDTGASAKDELEVADVTTTPTNDEISALNSDERAAMYFDSQIKQEQRRALNRQTAMENARRTNPRDPNLAFDKDFIEQRRAIIRGYEDAKRGAIERGKKARAIAEKKAHPDLAAAAAIGGKASE